jgi:uncharacterized protein
MAVRLRPHHLLCMLSYAGRGYSPAFVANFDAVVRRLEAGEEIVVVSGADDICIPLLCEDRAHCDEVCSGSSRKCAAKQYARANQRSHLIAICSSPHCLRASVAVRDAAAAEAIGAYLGRPIAAGDVLAAPPETVAALRDAFAAGTLRKACGGCEWQALCSEVAAEGWQRARLPI